MNTLYCVSPCISFCISYFSVDYTMYTIYYTAYNTSNCILHRILQCISYCIYYIVHGAVQVVKTLFKHFRGQSCSHLYFQDQGTRVSKRTKTRAYKFKLSGSVAKAACEYSLALVWPIRVSVDTCRPRQRYIGRTGRDQRSDGCFVACQYNRSISRDNRFDRETLKAQNTLTLNSSVEQ